MQKLIVLLHNLYGQEKKIYLLGHSWGGLIIPLFLEKENNQSLVNGWIQVDGVHDYPFNDSASRISLIDYGSKEISLGHHTEDWNKIVNYCKGHDPKNNYDVSRKINSYANSTDPYIPEINKSKTLGKRLRYFVENYRFPVTSFLSNVIYNNLIAKIDKQAYTQDVRGRLGRITTPSLLLWGRYDFVCPTSIMDDLKHRISSPDVNTKIFERSGHSPMDNEPLEFWRTVTDWVKVH